MNKIRECQYCEEEYVWTRDLGNSCRVCKNGMYRYDMTRLDMIALHESQDKRCLLCEKEVVLFTGTSGGNVDHCHVSGKVRGILCAGCNTTVGGMETHIEQFSDISRLLEYIEN